MDIVERLRNTNWGESAVSTLLRWQSERAEAAAEIERLREREALLSALLEIAREHLNDASPFLEFDDWRADVGRLVDSIDAATAIASGEYRKGEG